MANSCILFRRARQEVFSRWYTTPAADTFYIQAAGGPTDNLGLLEEDLLRKITTWRSREWKVEDTIAPTFVELIKTFQDNDGDFSGYQIRRMLLTDGETRRVFKKTSEGLLGRFLPKIEPAPEATDKIREAQAVIEGAVRQLLGVQRDLGNDLFLALRRTVFKRPDKTADPVQEQNAALRKKLLYYVIGISFALALALCCIASV